jgi:hypothetical protein
MNRDYDNKIKSLEKENKQINKSLNKKVKSTSKLMDQFASKPSKRPQTGKKIEYNLSPNDRSNIGMISNFTPMPKRMDAKSAKDLNILDE